VEESKEVFFSEEKNQKTFTSAVADHAGARGSEFAQVFCFFSSEKKTFLLSLRRRMNTAFRVSPVCSRIKPNAGQILSAAFICLHAAPRVEEGKAVLFGRKEPKDFYPCFAAHAGGTNTAMAEIAALFRRG
jgi:hypothetical protein